MRISLIISILSISLEINIFTRSYVWKHRKCQWRDVRKYRNTDRRSNRNTNLKKHESNYSVVECARTWRIFEIDFLDIAASFEKQLFCNFTVFSREGSRYFSLYYFYRYTLYTGWFKNYDLLKWKAEYLDKHCCILFSYVTALSATHVRNLLINRDEKM